MVATREETIHGRNGGLFVRGWWPEASPRAVVAICHGFNSHSGYYAWVGKQLAADRVATCAIDLRGRGKSSGARYYVDSFDDYVADLATLVDYAKAAVPDVPLFVLGHSAGGVTACLYALEHSSELAGLICEDFAYAVPAPGFALAILKGLSHLAPRARSITLKNEDFSRDPEVVAAMNADPLIQGESQPLATMAAIVRADERLKRSFAAITAPVLIIHGTADKAAKPSGSAHFYEHAGSADKTLKLYEGRFHDPLNDIGKEEVMADILQWINARISSPQA